MMEDKVVPTGSLTIVADHMNHARIYETHMDTAVENLPLVAMSHKIAADNCKVRAGMEMLLWVLAVLKMPAEPNPWQELQAKIAAQKARGEIT